MLNSTQKMPKPKPMNGLYFCKPKLYNPCMVKRLAMETNKGWKENICR